MSFSRDCVIWECSPGKYRLGAFLVTWVGSEADGHDPEWDVEYDYDQFGWVGPICYTVEDAWRSWAGANPGGYNLYQRASPQCGEFNRMAQRYARYH